MIELYNFINDLGYLSADYFWFPLLIWSAVAALTFYILRFSDSINPLYQYHIRIATLFALPFGLLSTLVIQLVSNLSASGASVNPAVFIVNNPLQENVANFNALESTPLNWLDGNILIGSATLFIITVAVFFLIKLIRDYVQLRILYSNLETEPLTNLDSEYGINNHSVSVAFNDHPLVPFTFGWRNPVIVLPSQIRNNKEKLNMAIRHELVHIQRGDYLIQLFLSMISSLFWFHPFVRMSEKKIETFREISCDQHVLNTSDIHPKNYANMLIELIPLQKGISNFAVKMAVQQSTLKQRIEKMKYHKLHKTSLKKSFMLFLGMIVILIAPIACSDLKNDDSLTIEELGALEIIMDNPTIEVNGKQITNLGSFYNDVKINALSGITIGAREYGVFVISTQKFPEAILAGSMKGKVIDFKVNQLNLLLINENKNLIEGTSDIWVKHYPNKKSESFRFSTIQYTDLQNGGYVDDLIPTQNLNIKDLSDEDLFVVVEEMPKLIGGQIGLQSKVEYPKVAIRAGIEGRVTVQFVVDKNGDVINPKIIRGIGAGCDEEALRVVSQAKFTPGKQRGRSVNVQMSMPVLFKLTN